MTIPDDTDDETTLRSSRPRFAPIPERLLLDRSVSGEAVRLWGILDRVAQRDRLWPGRELLAERLGCSPRTVDRHLADLTSAGWLEVKRRGQGRTNLYVLHDRPATPDTDGESGVVKSGDSGVVKSGDSEVDTDGHLTRAREREEENESTTRAPATVAGSATARAQAAVEAFAEWWVLYPRKVGKPQARKAFVKAMRSGATLEAITEGLGPWIAYWRTRDDPEFIPYPATWLNREGWNDEPPRVGRSNRPQAATIHDTLAALEDGYARQPEPRQIGPGQ